MIELDERLVGIWYVAFKDPRDLMGVIQCMGPGRYKSIWRLKQYASPDPWCKDDSIATRETLSDHDTEAAVIVRMRAMLDGLADIWGADIKWELLRAGRSLEEFAELLIAMPGANTKTVTEAEFNEFRRMLDEP